MEYLKPILNSLALISITVILRCQDGSFTVWYRSPFVRISIKIQSELICASRLLDCREACRIENFGDDVFYFES